MNFNSAEAKSFRWPVYTVEMLLLALFVLAVYGQTYGFPFTGYDDPVVIVDNEAIRDIGSLEGLWNVVKPEAQEGLSEWMPLKNLSLALDYAVLGDTAQAYRPQTLLWYILCVIAFHSFIINLIAALNRYGITAVDRRSQRITAFMAALLFAAHPVHVQSVAWLSERKDLLTMTFFFAGLALHLKSYMKYDGGRLSQKTGVMILYLLALLSKPSALGFPIMIVMLDAVLDRRPGFIRRHVWNYAAYFVLTLAFTVFYMKVAGVINEDGSENLREGVVLFNGTKLQLIGQQLSMYFIWTLWPVKLIHHPLFELSETYMSASVLLGLLFLGLLVAVGFLCLRRAPLPAVAAGLFFAGLFPVIGRAPFGQYYEVRYLLFSVAAPALLLAWLYIPLMRRGLIILAYALPLIIVVFWTAITLRDSLAWSSHEALWLDALAKEPRLWVAHKNLGVYYVEVKNMEKAAAHAEACLALNPASENCICIKALAMYRGNRRDEAQQLLENSMQYNKTGKIADNLAVIYLEKGEKQKALDFYAVHINGRLVYSTDLAHYASFMLAAGELEKALELYLKARSIRETGAYDYEKEIKAVQEQLEKKAAEENRQPASENSGPAPVP